MGGGDKRGRPGGEMGAGGDARRGGGRAGPQGRLPLALRLERRAQRREPPGRGHQLHPRRPRHYLVGANLVLLVSVHAAPRGSQDQA